MNDIFERLPNHLMLARNSNAPEFDRWRLYSLTNEKYLEATGSDTAESCMAKYIELEEKIRREWCGREL